MIHSLESAWLLLVLSLPTQSATARMRIWRALKAQGCAALRDGAYLLPATAQHHEALSDLAGECVREGGNAWVMHVQPSTSADDFQVLFDRSEDYAAMIGAWKSVAAALALMPVIELARLQRKLRREYEALRAIDFFPGEPSLEAEAGWAEFNQRLERLQAPDEPHDAEGQIARLEASAYQGRLWATRRRLWVDRVASAWLIRRFIDPQARFKWLDKPSDCPRKAVGFDFDGAEFSHVGDCVTFENLLASFGLDEDRALVRLGAMVHVLDVGGEPVPEARGFEAVMTGARERLPDDDALLQEIGAVLDSLYIHFQRPAKETQ
jgi:hypothetical protein